MSPAATAQERRLRAGAATSNITPPLGELIVGNWSPVPATHVHDELHARCLVLDDGGTQSGDRRGGQRRDSAAGPGRGEAAGPQALGIPAERILISSTHTHSATTARGSADWDDPAEPLDHYQAFLAARIADGIRRAVDNLEPARVGWGSGSLPEQVFNRRWFMKPGPHLNNPFGGTDTVQMNPQVGSPDLLKPAGPTDPEIGFLSVQSASGRPIALARQLLAALRGRRAERARLGRLFRRLRTQDDAAARTRTAQRAAVRAHAVQRHERRHQQHRLPRRTEAAARTTSAWSSWPTRWRRRCSGPCRASSTTTRRRSRSSSGS